MLWKSILFMKWVSWIVIDTQNNEASLYNECIESFFWSYIINIRKVIVGHGVYIPHASLNFKKIKINKKSERREIQLFKSFLTLLKGRVFFFLN